MQIPFTKIIGSNLKFSLFDFYGPIVGSFIGSVFGLITILTMQLINWCRENQLTINMDEKALRAAKQMAIDVFQ